ncbi:hypothetical protein Peur_062580 [Populus x canadensis]
MTNEPWNLLPLKGRVDEWEKDLVLENKHNLKQLIVLMWDQVSSPTCSPVSMVTSE